MGRRSGVSWAIGVIAPWWLGAGLLVSFTAAAGQDPSQGWNIPPHVARMQTARLSVGTDEDVHAQPDEREPHAVLKPHAESFPEVDRAKKGDPIIAMRPSFDSKRNDGETVEVSLGLGGETTIVALAGPEAADFPADSGGAPTTQRGNGQASPTQRGSATTQRISEAMRERAAHGATPPVARAAALASSTPAQPDAVPIAVASFAPSRALQDTKTPPDYASLIDPDKLAREKRCLAEAVYFESRSEPEAGQAAVAQVVLNRVSSGLYPTSVCGVVYQNRSHYKACQFSFACEGKRLRVTEPDSWTTAQRIADEVMNGHTYISDVGRSTHYHANYVKPRWAKALKKMDKIGNHIFYRLRPGQT
ncbi:cell wall hydrolase [Methylosinus sp. Ce-a6]|uniref:cell wall hydrolase n=1 Tax=Methylosinus sp. Ce-a6 TaxID=2172005 RepID=UPI0019152745|nr:cell wall hydrolase [Methylosinus sp. Ce-a6]